MCLFNLYRSKKKIIVTGKIQPIGLAALCVKKFDNCQVFHKYLQNSTANSKTKPQKLIYGFVYLLYPVLVVSAKVQLENKNLQNILTPKSCIHLKKDDSFSPGSSG
jgi:hypothetical protein